MSTVMTNYKQPKNDNNPMILIIAVVIGSLFCLIIIVFVCICAICAVKIKKRLVK